MTKSKKKLRNYEEILYKKVPCCSLPVIPDRHLNDNIDPKREFLIRYIEKKMGKPYSASLSFLQYT